MALFCARLAYDGTGYHGFQYQAGVPTIQSALEKALCRFAQLEGRVAGAGRTDTGVHASGQVITAQVSWRHGPGALQEAWNAHLPRDIHLRQMVIAPDGFHPRFDAVARTYRYRVVVYDADGVMTKSPRPRRSPLTDRFAYFEPGPLNLEAMNRATALVVGEHDFASFGWPTQGESTVRRVMRAEWRNLVWQDAALVEPLDGYPGRRYVLTIQANGFLRRMMRKIVGTLLDVGRGLRSVESVANALAVKDRSATGPGVPANGLMLEKVDYPETYSFWE